MSTSAAARVSNGRSPRAATAPTPISRRIEITSPSPLDAEPEDHQACGDEHEGPPCRDVSGGKCPRVLRLAQPLHEHDDPQSEEQPT